MITRENYEEFFLSYVDNELPAETRLAVERFVAANPDLSEELDTLLQCRLEPEPDALYPHKDSLLQYEESLLLYVDGELDEAGQKTVEDLAQREPRLAQELKHLRLTVSEPDPGVVFPGKESLYRPVNRRIISMPWFRAAAAAAVAAVALLLLLPRGHKANVSEAETVQGAAVVRGAAVMPDDTVEKNDRGVVTPSAVSPFYSRKDDVPRAVTKEQPTRATATPKVDHPVYAVIRKKGKERTKTPSTKIPTLPAPAVAVTNRTNTTSPAHITGGMDGVTPGNAVAATETTPVPDPSTTLHSGKAAATSVAAVNIPRDQRSFATQALLREAQDASDGDMADNMSPAAGKTKLRGLFRRVTRAFGKTADRDDDGQRQVSISVFQVALK